MFIQRRKTQFWNIKASVEFNSEPSWGELFVLYQNATHCAQRFEIKSFNFSLCCSFLFFLVVCFGHRPDCGKVSLGGRFHLVPCRSKTKQARQRNLRLIKHLHCRIAWLELLRQVLLMRGACGPFFVLLTQRTPPAPADNMYNQIEKLVMCV